MRSVFRSRSEEFMRLVDKETDKALAEAALAMSGIIKVRTPVDTGRLRQSITASSAMLDGRCPSGEAEVGTNVEYAPYVEYGTRYQKAQPYMRTGGDESGRTVERIMRTRMSRLGLDVEVSTEDRG